MTLIYKICSHEMWQDAIRDGAFAGAPVDLADGFIHFSTGAQVQETAGRHFRGQRDLVLVCVDSATFGDALKWEPSRGGDLFPHLYGAFPVTAALWVRALVLGEDGGPVIPDEIAS